MEVYQIMLKSGEMVYILNKNKNNRKEVCKKDSHKIKFEPGRIDVVCNHENVNLKNIVHDVNKKLQEKRN